MRQHVTITRPDQRRQVLREMTRPTALPRTLARTSLAIPIRRRGVERQPAQPGAGYGFEPNPYLDYGRFLTAEGGILVIYKDLDLRLRHTIWRLLAWSIFTAPEAAGVLVLHPLQSPWLTLVCAAIVAAINWWIVSTPVQIYRHVEIRPDCLILDGADVFWARFMENGIPKFSPDTEGNQILSGIYGTRLVYYLTARRFDANDKMPEVISAHLADAMHQLWSKPYH